jgi:hypothetical protein
MDVKSQLDENQQKQYEWEQDQIAHMKEYVCGGFLLYIFVTV